MVGLQADPINVAVTGISTGKGIGLSSVLLYPGAVVPNAVDPFENTGRSRVLRNSRSACFRRRKNNGMTYRC